MRKWQFKGTAEEWSALHHDRVAVVADSMTQYFQRKVGYHVSQTAFCVPESPCDGCKLWTRLPPEKEHSDGETASRERETYRDWMAS